MLWQAISDEFGLTFVQCRRAVLMRRAAIELIDINQHVRQIAFRLGYSDAANFDHEFRRFFGLTPTAFRRLGT
jgi:AraC-like DNA-binding protein